MAALVGGVEARAQQALLEEDIVTAQKRSENVMDVPIAISVFNAETIESLSARNLTDLGRFTAGVEMINTKSLQPTYTIRGVQTNDWTAGSDPAVAVYVDGVYAARGAGAEAALVDLARVEVLKGPQGTLLGRNAMGGAIHIISNKPTMAQEGRVKVSVGDYNRIDGEVVINQPVGDGLAFRVIGLTRNRDGYMNSPNGPDLNDEDQQAIRLVVLWTATDRTEVLWRAEYSEVDQHSATHTALIPPTFELANPDRRLDTFGDVATDFVNREQREMFSSSLEINHVMDGMTFTAITGWREYETELDEDLDGANNPDYVLHGRNPQDNDYLSQEFRLTGFTQRLKWTLGAGYSREHVAHDTIALFNLSTLEPFAGAEILKNAGSHTSDTFPGVIAAFEPWPEEAQSSGTYESWAVYGDATWSISDGLNLTGGLRYTRDDKAFDLFTQHQNQIVGADFGLAFYDNGQPVLDVTQRESWDNVSGRMVLDYAVGDDAMVYGSVSTGFKSGGFNTLNVGPVIDTSYDDEEVINYETGLKGQFLQRRLNLNLAVFFYEYDNLQELKLLGQPTPGYNLLNSDAEGYGLEVEALWLATPDLTLGGNYSWLKTEYTKFNILEAAGESPEEDLTGEPRTGTPEHKVNLHLEYVIRLGDYGRLVPRLDYSWNDTRLESLTDPAREVDAFSITNARLTLLPDAANWEIALWSTNLFDEEVHIEFGDNGDAIGSLTAARIPPRMVGADFAYHF